VELRTSKPKSIIAAMLWVWSENGWVPFPTSFTRQECSANLITPVLGAVQAGPLEEVRQDY